MVHDHTMVGPVTAVQRGHPDKHGRAVWTIAAVSGLIVAFTPSAGPDGPVLWLGRFSPDKAPELAAAACRAAGLPLVLAGRCSEPSECRYYRRAVRPLLG